MNHKGDNAMTEYIFSLPIKEYRTQRSAEKLKAELPEDLMPWIFEEPDSSFGDLRAGPFYKVYVV